MDGRDKPGRDDKGIVILRCAPQARFEGCDRPHYGDVVGVSLVSPCTFRMRRKRGTGWERASLRLAPRSIYLLRGPARDQWEHSIPAVDALRYSVTFRSARNPSS